mgnify:CR=1 FL=1
MKITKQARRHAKRLFQACLVNGLPDEQKMRATVSAVAERQPRGYLAILTHFQRLARLELARRKATIESAAPLSAAVREALQAHLVRRHGEGLRFEFLPNPSLIGGLRIQVGSNVYDGSLRARLRELEEKLAR